MIKVAGKLVKKIVGKPIEMFNNLAISKFPEEAIQIQLTDMNAELDGMSRDYARVESERNGLLAELKTETDEDVKVTYKECIDLLESILVESSKNIIDVKARMKTVKAQIIKLQSKTRILKIKQRTLEAQNSKFKADLGIKTNDSILNYMNNSVKKLEEKIRAYEVKLN